MHVSSRAGGAIALVSTMFASTPCRAQDALIVGDSAARRAFAVRIAALPGVAVPLDSLLRIARREGLDARSAEIRLRERRGVERSARGVYDPVASITSGLQSPHTAGIGNVRRVDAALGMTIPTGMQLGVGTVISRSNVTSNSNDLSSIAPTQSSLTVSAEQPLLQGFRQASVEPRATAEERLASTLTLARTRQSVSLDVESAYWLLAEAQATEAVYERSVEISKEFLRRYEELVSRDLVAGLDVLTMRSGAAQREAALNAAQQSRRDRSDALVLVVYGVGAASRLLQDTVPIKTVDEVLQIPTVSLFEIASIVRQRADIQAADAMQRGATMRLERARNAVRPSLALTGAYTSTRTPSAFASLTSGNTPGAWQLGLSLGLPVLNRVDVGAAEQVAAAADLAGLVRDAAISEATAQVRAALRAVEMGRTRLDRAEQAAAYSWTQLAAERRRVELGLGDAFRLLQTEEFAVRTQLESVSARYELNRAAARLRLALGRDRAAY